MTQLPTITDRLISAAEESARTRALSAGRVANPFDQLYFTSDNKPTFEEPTTGVLGAIGKRIFLSQEATDSFGLFEQTFFRSIAEMTSDLLDDDLTAPIARVGNDLLLGGETIPFDQATAKQAFSTLPPAVQLTMEMSGYGADNLTYLNIHSAEDLEERWSAMVQGTRARQALESFNRNANGLQKTGAVAGEFAVNLITDPVAIAGVVFTGGTATAARAGAKQGVSVVTKRYLADGVVATVVTRSGLAKRRVASRLLFWGSGAVYAGGMDAANQIGQQDYDIQYGLRSPSEGISLDYVELGIAGSVGTLFGEIGFRAAGLGGTARTRKTHRTYTETEDLASYVMTKEERLGRRSKDEIIQNLDIDAPETLEQMAKYTLSHHGYEKLAKALADDDGVGDINISEWADFLLQLPDGKELDDLLAGNRPELTTFARLTNEVFDLSDQITAANARGDKALAKSLKRKHNAVRNELDLHVENNLNIVKDTRDEVSEAIREIARQRPVSSYAKSSERIAHIQEILHEGLNKSSEAFRVRSLTPKIQSFINKIGGKFNNIQQQRRIGMQSEDATEVLFSKMSGLIDEKGLDHTEHLVNTKQIRYPSTRENFRYAESKIYLPAQEVWRKATKGKSPEEINAIGYMVKKAHNNGNLDGVPSELHPLVKHYSNFYRLWEREGLKWQYFDNTLDNYMSVVVHRDSPMTIDDFADIYSKWFYPKFDPNNPSSEVSYNVLQDMGFAKREGNRHVPKGDFFDELPTKVSQIPDDLREAYAERLAESLYQDGKKAYLKRVSKRELLSVDPDDPNLRKDTPLRPNNQSARRLEQEFYLTDAMRDSGFVNFDLEQEMRTYMRGTGYNISRHNAISEYVGDSIHWNDFLVAGKNMTSKGTGSRAALERMIELDNIQSKRRQIPEDGAVFASTFQHLAGTFVTHSIGPTIVTLELSGSLIHKVFGKRSVTDLIAGITNTLREAKLENAKEFGIVHVHESNRFIGDISEYTPSSVRDNPAVKWSASLERQSRRYSLENPITRLARASFADTEYSQLHLLRNKLNKLRGLSRRFDSVQDLKDAARKAGIDPERLRRLRSFGILDDEALDVAGKLLEIDGNALRDRRALAAAANQLSPEDSKAASRLDANLTRMANDTATTFAVDPSAASRMTANNPILQMGYQFLGYVSGFYNQTIPRVAQSPYWKQIGGLSFLVTMEISNSIIRDILYNGHSPETVMEKWEKDPVKELALILTRLPLYGPMNPVPLVVAGAFGGRQFGIENMASAPALGMAGRILGSAQTLAKAKIRGDDVPDSVYRTIHRTLPGDALWYVRIVNEGMYGFQEDADR